MYKSGMILAALSLFVAAGATLISPVCAPCAALFLGLGAGYLAGVFDKAPSNNAASKAGAIGGALAGIGALLGQVLGTVINATLVSPETIQKIYQNFGLPSAGPGFSQSYWVGLVGSAICLSVLDVLVMAGTGALGGMLWWQTTGKNARPPAPTAIG